MRATPTTLFTDAARKLADATHSLGLAVPGFRSPPRIVGVDRTIRRGVGSDTTSAQHNACGGVVAVRLRDRPFTAVISDMIEGVIVLNRLAPPEADHARSALWAVMLQFTVPTTVPTTRVESHDSAIARVA
jgi:hypothetical protein